MKQKKQLDEIIADAIIVALGAGSAALVILIIAVMIKMCLSI